MHVLVAPTARFPATMHVIAVLAVLAATILSIRTRYPNVPTQTFHEKPFRTTFRHWTRYPNTVTNFVRTDKMAPTDNQTTIDRSTAQVRDTAV